MRVDEVVFRDDLYPRIEKNPVVVQKYAEDLSVLPPIEVNQHGEMIDGWHRWTAHRKVEAEEIAAIVTETASDAEFLELAIERNAKHGMQLSQADKQAMARQIYNVTDERERKGKKLRLSEILSVSESTIKSWLSRIDKDTKKARNQRIFDSWLACYTEAAIGKAENLTKEAISLICQEKADLPKLDKSRQSTADHADLKPPIYNIWKQQEKTAGDTEAETLYSEAVTGKAGNPAGSNQHQKQDGNSDNITISTDGRGTSLSYGLRRLHKQAPELHKRVLAGELTTNAAMIEAGFRRKTVTVVLDRESWVASILKHCTKEDRRYIAESITSQLTGATHAELNGSQSLSSSRRRSCTTKSVTP